MSSHPSNANDVFARPRRPVDFHRPPLQVINQIQGASIAFSALLLAFLGGNFAACVLINAHHISPTG